MGLVLRLLSIIAAIIFVISVVLAVSLFWEFNYGDCKDGCGEGMAYILFLPALVIAGLSGIIATAAHFIGKRVRADSD